MSIAFSKYIDITSGVAAAPVGTTRDLIGRIISINPLVPVGYVLEFTTLVSVGDYFGTSSEEYLRALFYFSYISKLITKPNKLSFSRWVKTATEPKIFGAALSSTLAELQEITDGSFTLSIGGVIASVTGLDFSGAANLSAVAALIQAGIVAEGTGTQFTNSTVSYNSARGSFDFVGGDAVAAEITVSAGAIEEYNYTNRAGDSYVNEDGDRYVSTLDSQDISAIIGWFPQAVNISLGAIWSDGSLAETITESLTAATDVSNNFGSYVFTSDAGLTIDEITESAAWNASQNVLFQYYVPVSSANASAYSSTLSSYNGCGVTLDPAVEGEFPEMAPMLLLASTKFEGQNSVSNYKYQQFDLTASVTTTEDSDAYDLLNINYYGSTQQAGQKIAFYQNGVLMGLATSPRNMNIYGNEQWLKDAAGVALMNLSLALPKISANAQGISQMLISLQSTISQGLRNGVISVGKSLSTQQISSINILTQDPDAWRQVQGSGYWVNCYITTTTVGDATSYVANYLLVYSKDDTVSKIVGQHVLI